MGDIPCTDFHQTECGRGENKNNGLRSCGWIQDDGRAQQAGHSSLKRGLPSLASSNCMIFLKGE